MERVTHPLATLHPHPRQARQGCEVWYEYGLGVPWGLGGREALPWHPHVGLGGVQCVDRCVPLAGSFTSSVCWKPYF